MANIISSIFNSSESLLPYPNLPQNTSHLEAFKKDNLANLLAASEYKSSLNEHWAALNSNYDALLTGINRPISLQFRIYYEFTIIPMFVQ